ncbi:sulfite exporter TauE/SafE family protein [Oxynema sp. CENA135]|uniref:sulfite exporter TauE/SafE family protein n=1 Tax=Oxynema sp. CENA135 TaxID=984206 RepID=UPI001909DE23|nr:sulfite exporter TauE/SafE family protein [Oxynema sp. CENA135]MBK4732159.1 sulfite exporter TauE/SafE family protein [Oxynema sp. CENA135]
MPELTTEFTLFCFGIVIGAIGAMFGLGGGFLIVPLLSIWGIPVVEAAATSLVGVLLTSISGTVRNWWQGDVDGRSCVQLALFGIPTAQLGAWLGDRLPDRILSIGFALFLFVALFLLHWRQQKLAGVELPEAIATDREGEISDSWGDRLGQFAQIGAIAGILAGLFGVGGGIVIVPLLLLLTRATLRSAAATSLGAIVPISASALTLHAFNGNILWLPGVCLGLGGIFGAQFGIALMPYLPAKLLDRTFQFLLLALALYMSRPVLEIRF